MRRVPTEDIAVKCFDIKPDNFSWIKYPKYPDKDIARSALVDARKKKNGVLVSGRTGRGIGQYNRTKSNPRADGWELTKDGAKWITENESRIIKKMALTHNYNRQESLRLVLRYRNNELFKTYMRDMKNFQPSVGLMAELFRCRVDADKRTWDKRFQFAMNLAQLNKDDDLSGFVNVCRECVLNVVAREGREASDGHQST
jgi:hypothetical protein